MKKILYFFITLLFINPGFSQYTVTKVIGTVKKTATSELLKPGSHFSETDHLEWSSPNDMVRTIIAGKGIFIITPSPKAEKEGSKLLEIVKFTLHLKSKEYNLSGRSTDDDLLPSTLNTEEAINTKNLISVENKYLFDKAAYDVSDGSKFFIQTELPGSKPVIKSLETHSDTLMIYSSDFKDATADTANTKYKLGFYSKENNSSRLLVQIKPYFDTANEMETIMGVLIAANEKAEKEQLKEQCYLEIYQALGKPSDICFQNSFEKIFSTSAKDSASKN